MDPSFVIVGAAAFSVGAAGVAAAAMTRAVGHARRMAVMAKDTHGEMADVTVDTLAELREIKRHDARVTELLDANNRLLARARSAEIENMALSATNEGLSVNLGVLAQELYEAETNLALQEAEVTALKRDIERADLDADFWADQAKRLGYDATAPGAALPPAMSR